MTKITCDMCMDLLPLVRDGIASADSEAAVRQHMERCPTCKAALEGELPQTPDSRRVYQKLVKHIRLMALLILLFGLCFGLSLSGDGDLFYNVWLMPLLGAIGYGIFRWKALWTVPLLVTLVHFAMNALGLIWEGEFLPWNAQLLWSFYYSLFAVVGTAIAGLIHFALRKEH